MNRRVGLLIVVCRFFLLIDHRWYFLVVHNTILASWIRLARVICRLVILVILVQLDNRRSHWPYNHFVFDIVEVLFYGRTLSRDDWYLLLLDFFFRLTVLVATAQSLTPTLLFALNKASWFSLVGI